MANDLSRALAPNGDATSILMIRHTDVHNPDDVFYGRLPRFGLSKVGLEQAEATARAIAHLPVTRIYASPQLRARQTAAILARTLGVPVSGLVGVAEIRMSVQGMTWKAIGTNVNLYDPKRAPTDESMAEVFLRMNRALRLLRRRHPGQFTVGVSHADPIMILRVGHLGKALTIENLRGEHYPQKGSITRFDFAPGAEVATVSYLDVNQAAPAPTPAPELVATSG